MQTKPQVKSERERAVGGGLNAVTHATQITVTESQGARPTRRDF